MLYNRRESCFFYPIKRLGRTVSFMNILKSRRRLTLIAIDFCIQLFVYLVVAVLMFVDKALVLLPLGYVCNFFLFSILIISVRFILKVYSNVWRYANSSIYVLIIAADIIGGCLAYILCYIPLWSSFLKVGVWQCIAFVSMADIATLVSRFAYQIFYKYMRLESDKGREHKIGVAIVGAGQVGSLLSEELLYNIKSKYNPICFVDSDPRKVGIKINGISVLSEDEFLLRYKEMPVQEIFIAIPKMDNDKANDLLRTYSKTECKIKIYDFPLNDSGVGRRVVRDFNIEDLLFRDSLKVIDTETKRFYFGRTVLVTGGGGSIGSELCRQIASCNPKKLIIFDIYENNAYDIQQELIRKYGDSLDLSVEIGSVRDRVRLETVFKAYNPELVLHAAAHKHVPLMEHSAAEVVKNNILGTYNTADMAEKYGAEKFILISTDKAVNPTNVMGASKRFCEMIVQSRFDSKTAFAAVRFGNVLGSNGSVIPLFKRQIETGGPITVTDRNIIRYFMTIPEASGLVMQAGAMAKGGDLFVLDMGKPVKILELAENMVRLSGFVPYKDIDIVETGLRPGEKLYEELLIKSETLDKTANNMIFIERDTPLLREKVEERLELLKRSVIDSEDSLDPLIVKNALKQAVPTFVDPEELNKTAESCDEMKMAMAVGN